MHRIQQFSFALASNWTCVQFGLLFSNSSELHLRAQIMSTFLFLFFWIHNILETGFLMKLLG